jgi:very-short-patch-repair endonuclease
MRQDGLRRAEAEEALANVVPGLVDAVAATTMDPAWDERFADWPEAWQWAVADSWLDKRSDFEYQQNLWRRHHEIERDIGQLLAEGAALRAWTHFFARLKAPEAAALKSWREAVKSMGKGTGRSAKLARLRREARRYMDSCRDAIPVWIMPRYLVAEMIEPAQCRYDLVIVDEASQLGIESLFLFYIGKKLVVVGDDQQISPYGVGIADAAIAGLQHHYLDGIRHQHALSAQSSLYANAKIRFSRNIVLREHFRCMPEIIQFSNDLCYASNGTPLDPLRAYPANRLQPTVLRQVSSGYRIGGPQHAQNPPEADAIVAQIVACVEDPRYSKATMGVISLQGEAQAKLIERKLLEHLDPAIIEERRLICGDAYAFQGDERNIIFLSMVAAPGERRIGALTAESARQRFNVAVSRAQDQLWLFHTATLDVLSDACMRHRLLSYMLEPGRETSEEHEQRFESTFERDVFRHITERGFHVRTQVCVGDPTNHRYRIDLVVEGMQGRLAVECDGDAWHGPERYEHDMARQRDLERAGWQFARIRGGDFYRKPAEAMEPIWAELERLGIRPGGVDIAAAEPPAPIDLGAGDETTAVPFEGDTLEPDSAAVDAVSDSLFDSVNTFESESPGTHSAEDPAEKVVPSVLTQTPGKDPEKELFPREAPATIENGMPAPYAVFEGNSGPDPRGATPARVAEGLCRIIEVEGPMVAKRAYDTYLRGCDIRRLGGELRRSMNRALQHAIQSGQVLKEDESGKGGLVYSVVRSQGVPPVVVRARGPRSLEEIPPSELQFVGRRIAAEEGLETGSDAHLRALLDFFDLKRLTLQAGTALLDVFSRQFPYVDRMIDQEQK